MAIDAAELRRPSDARRSGHRGVSDRWVHRTARCCRPTPPPSPASSPGPPMSAVLPSAERATAVPNCCCRRSTGHGRARSAALLAPGRSRCVRTPRPPRQLPLLLPGLFGPPIKRRVAVRGQRDAVPELVGRPGLDRCDELLLLDVARAGADVHPRRAVGADPRRPRSPPMRAVMPSADSATLRAELASCRRRLVGRDDLRSQLAPDPVRAREDQRSADARVVVRKRRGCAVFPSAEMATPLPTELPLRWSRSRSGPACRPAAPAGRS